MWLPLIGSAILVAGIAVTGLGTAGGEGAVPSESPVPIAGGTFQASAVVHVPATRRFLFVDDDRYTELFAFEIGSDGKQRGDARATPLGARVTDPEGMTYDGRYFYVVGSQSKPIGFEGDGLVRFVYDAGSGRTTGVERIEGLKAWLSRHVPELRGIEHRVGDHVVNIEGLAWDPDGQRLLLGLRAPVIDDSALIVPVRLSRGDAPFTRENLTLAGETIRLSLGGAGIRSIEFDEKSKRYRIITGASLNDETLDFQVLEWDGTPGSKLVGIRSYGKELKPEGVTTADELRVLVFDTGLLQVVR